MLGSASAETRVRGSRFLAEAVHVEHEKAAEEAIALIRRREHAATHHCSAYRIGPDAEIFRYNDDGEPSGTAGPPILRRIEALGLSDVLVVVTRYYGGTKLGTGGLARAYGEAAAEALARATIVSTVVRCPLTLRFGYEDTSPAMHVLGRFDVETVATHYSEVTEMDVKVRLSEAEAFMNAFVEALRGRGSVERKD